MDKIKHHLEAIQAWVNEGPEKRAIVCFIGDGIESETESEYETATLISGRGETIVIAASACMSKDADAYKLMAMSLLGGNLMNCDNGREQDSTGD